MSFTPVQVKPPLIQPQPPQIQQDDKAVPKKARASNAKSKKLACVECRQQKSRCDAQELYPNPCTRCSKRKAMCVMQADYKRTYKRAKFQKIEQELESLKKNLTEVGADNLLIQFKEKDISRSISPAPYQEIKPLPLLHQTSIPSPLGNIHGPSIIRESSPNVIIPSKTNLELFVEFNEELLYCTPKELGEIQLSSKQIKELFLEFVNKYHRFLPIVDISKGPELIHRLCPILFWVIVSIALRHLSTNTLMELAPLLKSALAEITISPITRYLPNEKDEPILNVSSVYSVQALLLYSFWPPLTSSLSADSSWNTVGIAIFQAIRLGLNGPGTNNYNFQSESSNSLLKEHVKTWISCNIVSQTIATAFGFPSFVSFDSSVIDCTRPSGKSSNYIPTCIKHMVEISNFEDQVAKVLNSNTVDSMGLVDPVERLPLIKVLTQQLDELELKLENDEIDDIRKFQIYAARVHLLTYYFLDNSRVAPFELRRGLVSLYNSALTLLNHADTVTKKDPFFIKYVPIVFVLKIWQAAFIVAKLCHSSLSDVIDIGAGRQLYISAIQLTLKASVLKHDMSYRASGIMRNMWQLFKTLVDNNKDYDNLGVTIRSRMSSSVFFDCLWVLREQVGMIKLNPNQKNVSEENSNNEDEDDNIDDDVFDEEEDNKNPTDPGTVGSESSTSSQKKRPRTLSNNFDASTSARRIIRTIPLDPTPISLKARNDSAKSISLEDIVNKSPTNHEQRTPETKVNSLPIRTKEQLNKKQSVSPTNIPSLDIMDDWTSDMLWKDVDSVMNDFGFNIDDLAKTANLEGTFTVPSQHPKEQHTQSLFKKQ